jgi:hypothetical protein
VSENGSSGGGYLVFVWTPGGYQLQERQGELPALGAQVEEEGGRFRVTKVAPSPLPGDPRRCAYLQAL